MHRNTVPSPNKTESSQLRRSFRVRDGVALIISNVVGVGIFTTPALIAKLVPEPSAMLGLWIAGGGLPWSEQCRTRNWDGCGHRTAENTFIFPRGMARPPVSCRAGRL